MLNSSDQNLFEHDFHKNAQPVKTSAKETYEFTVCEPKHEDEIIDLLAPLWGPDRSIREASFDWKYRRNPYVQNPLIYLTLYQGHVVGTDAYAVSSWKAGSGQERYLCLQGADGVVSPEHRRRGLHYRMQVIAHAELENGAYHAGITLGANDLTVGSHLKAGAKSVTEMESLYWHPGKKGNSIRELARKVPGLPTVYHVFCGKVILPQLFEVSSQPHFHTLDTNYERNRFRDSHIVLKDAPEPKAMEALVNRNSPGGRITQVRDEAFFAWRYKNPLSVFRFVFWEKKGLRGYLVLQQPLYAGGKDVFIVDWEAENKNILSEMLGAVTRHGGFSSIGIWSVSVPGDILKVLRKSGFSPLDKGGPAETAAFRPHLMVVPFHGKDDYRMGGRNLLNLSEWDLRPIFADTY